MRKTRRRSRHARRGRGSERPLHHRRGGVASRGGARGVADTRRAALDLPQRLLPGAPREQHAPDFPGPHQAETASHRPGRNGGRYLLRRQWQNREHVRGPRCPPWLHTALHPREPVAEPGQDGLGRDRSAAFVGSRNAREKSSWCSTTRRRYGPKGASCFKGCSRRCSAIATCRWHASRSSSVPGVIRRTGRPSSSGCAKGVRRLLR